MAKMITIVLVLFLSSCMIIPFTIAANFTITNQCTYTVWAAAVPGGGKALGRGQSWEINVPPGTIRARIWGRTNCTFDANGKGGCETGDCEGILKCKMYGKPPNTLAEFAVNQTYKKDFIDISNVDGFNIPMEFSSVTPCRKIQCKGQINEQCPAALRTAGGCNNPCTVYKTIKYCCTPKRGSCGPTRFSRYFKEKCPNAYSYPQDDQTSSFTCKSGTNYKVVFCP